MGKASKSSHSADERPRLANPDFEVKLFLDAEKVLDADFRPRRRVEREFELEGLSRKMSMAFIDARPRAMHDEGWSVRIRRLQGDGEIELSYKRRYPLAEGGLEEAVRLAKAHGFKPQDKDYDAQVEWGFAKQTLSLTRRKVFDAGKHAGMRLPLLEESRLLALGEIPGRLDQWKHDGWARSILESCDAYGPVDGRRWNGKVKGPDLSLEVWRVKTEHGGDLETVVELSFKEKSQQDAAKRRELLLSRVSDQGWLLDRDVLKTEMILTRY